MSKRIPGPPEYWEQYLLCLLFHLLLPLFPLGAEFAITHGVSPSALTMTAAMYSITIGTSSHSKLMFGLSIMMCIVYSVAFGLIAGGGATTQAEAGKAATSAYFALPAIVAIAIIHAFERFNRHIIDRAPYWNFSGAAER